MQYSKMPEGQRAAVKNYIDEMSDLIRDGRFEAWKRLMNYLFALNAGSLTGALAYVGSAGKDAMLFSLSIPIKCFAAGLLCLFVHAGIDYFQSDFRQKDFFNALRKLYSDTLDWQELLDGIQKRRSYEFVLIALGVSSAIFGGVGLYLGLLCITG